MKPDVNTILLEFHSSFDCLDLVQLVSDHVGRLLGFDEDALHWVGVSVRESVINAIKHGNEGDETKRVFVEFTSMKNDRHGELVVAVRDQGKGFDPDALPDPLAPENLLKASGRGIFFMKNFMDEVVWRRRSEGGMEVRMVKKIRS
ncbi:MAG: ATP-binding protein [Acidobacteria bacterium]|nr:ATP-binding protein [Acidobacteriota bacterium]